MAGLREAARYNKRAFALWWRLDPQIFLSAASSCAVRAAAPYIGMYFTARLIDELAGGRDPAVLLRLTLALLLASAAAGPGGGTVRPLEGGGPGRQGLCHGKKLL